MRLSRGAISGGVSGGLGNDMLQEEGANIWGKWSKVTNTNRICIVLLYKIGQEH